MIGLLLDGRYQIIQALSFGGFGQTYLAEDTRRPGHPQCVVKQLRPPSNNPQVFQAAYRLFEKEAKTLENLGQCDYIPQLLAYFEENQEFYLVQQFIPGHTLASEILPGLPLLEDQVVSILTEVLEILVFVHGQRVIHRDVKPANILRRQSDSKLVLIDFGAVKEVTSQFLYPQGQLPPSIVIGTYGYMPVEQLQGYPQWNSDIYALGMVCIQALIGLAAGDLLKLQNYNNYQNGEVIWRNRVQINPQLADIIDKMVKFDYRQRYQSATEVLADLRNLRGSTSSSATPSTTINLTNQKPKHWKRKQFIIAGAGTFIVVSGLVIALYGLLIPQLRANEFYNLGLEKAQRGDKPGAIEEFNQAIQINPNYAKAYYERADARYHIADYEGAIEDSTQAIKINPNYAEAYSIRCGARANLKNYQAALKDCEQSIQLNPAYARAYLGLGVSYSALGDKQKAIESYTQAIRINPDLARAYSNRGVAREDLGDLQGAIEDYTLAIQKNPKDTRAYINRSDLRRRQQKNYQGAIEDAKQVIEINPENALAYYHRGLAYSKLGNKQKAIEDFQKTATLCLEQGNTGCYKDAQEFIKKLEQPTKTVVHGKGTTRSLSIGKTKPSNSPKVVTPRSAPRTEPEPEPSNPPKVVTPYSAPRTQPEPEPSNPPKVVAPSF